MQRTILPALLLGAVALLLPAQASANPHRFFANVPQGKTEIIAHRGGLTGAPENTITAFARAVALGADVLEGDARLTKDGILVMMHDETLERTTNGTGLVLEKTLAQLQSLRVQDVAPIPTLQEVLRQFANQRWVLEIKDESEQAADMLCATLRQNNMQERALVGSFYDETLQYFRTICPEVATSLAYDEGVNLLLKMLLPFLPLPESVPYVAAQIPPKFTFIDLATPKYVDMLHGLGLRVQYWTIDDPAMAQHLQSIGADGVITNNVEAMKRVLR